jgi:AraC family transcriptional regulator
MKQAKMMESPAAQLKAPRFENGKPLLIAGFRSHYTADTMNNIPAQWERFAPYIGKIPGQVGHAAYGVGLQAANTSGGIDYLSGVEVSSSSGSPGEFSFVAVPAQKYAVFPHREHVSKLRETLDAIWQTWLPNSGVVAARGGSDAPAFFERYGEDFDPRTGIGGIEVWIPIKA